MDLFKMGASMIEGNSEKESSGLDIGDISSALNGLLGDGQGGLNLASLVGSLSKNGLGEIVGSWLDNGENKGISIDEITALLGEDKIAEFASVLGISTASASASLAESVPEFVDKATKGEATVMDTMLGQVGGASGAMDMLGKMFR